MPEIKFVLVHDDRIHTRRSKELQDASIKSHAARKAARRRKRQQLKNAEPSTDNDQRQASWEIRRLDSPTSLLGGGNRDPFVSYPGALFPSIVLEAQDFNIQSYLWTVYPPNRRNEVAPAVASIKQLLVQHPYVFHAQALTAAGFVRSNVPDTKTQQTAERIWLEEQCLCIEGIREEIETCDFPSDGLIFAALSLASGLGKPIQDDVHLHPPSPFAAADLSYTLGTYTIVPELFEAVDRFVAQRGGIDGITHPVIRLILEGYDCYRSTRLSTPPLYPRPAPFHLLFSPHTPLPNKGNGYAITLELDLQVFTLYCLAAELTAALPLSLSNSISHHHQLHDHQHHQQNHTNNATTRDDLLLSRLDLHHGLLSLPPLPPEGLTPTTDSLLHEIARTSALLFSDMVLYPMPYSSGVKPRLVRQLYHALSLLPGEVWTGRYGGLLVWGCVLGAVCAGGVEGPAGRERRGFVGRLRGVIDVGSGWEGLHAVLRGWLWYEPVCGPPAAGVWEEMQVGGREGHLFDLAVVE